VRWWSGAIAGGLMLAACTDAGGDVRLPPRDVRIDYQLGGAYPAAEDGARVEDGVSVQRRDLPVGMPGSSGYVARWCER
jgi:hypothetical protein